MNLAEVRKLLTYVAGAASVVLSQGVLHGAVAHWVGVGLLVLTGAGIYVAKNAAPVT